MRCGQSSLKLNAQVPNSRVLASRIPLPFQSAHSCATPPLCRNTTPYLRPGALTNSASDPFANSRSALDVEWLCHFDDNVPMSALCRNSAAYSQPNALANPASNPFANSWSDSPSGRCIFFRICLGHVVCMHAAARDTPALPRSNNCLCIQSKSVVGLLAHMWQWRAQTLT